MLLLLVFTLVGMYRNPNLTLGSFALVWVLSNGPPTIILLTFLMRQIRAVGPLVLVIMMAGMIGSLSLPFIVTNSDLIQSIVIEIAVFFDIHGAVAYWIVKLIGFVSFSLLGWYALQWTVDQYRRKHISDQEIMLDALWLIFCLYESALFAVNSLSWVIVGPMAFMIYIVVLRIAFRWTSKSDDGTEPNPTLLFLRVFSLGVRSQHLFDALTKGWLRLGPISLISGPDLVTAIVQPREFLDFISGRLSRQFVRDQVDLERRLTQMDNVSDPDGRYRINEFFCRADTWKMTMRQLAAQSSVVLMDLRSFAKSNAGCIYELEQLLSIVPLPRVILLTDDTTGQEFLQEKLKELWPKMPEDSPNRQLADPEIRIFDVQSSSGWKTQHLLHLLLQNSLSDPILRST